MRRCNVLLISLLSTGILSSCSSQRTYDQFLDLANNYSKKSHLFIEAEFEIRGTFDGGLVYVDIDYDYNQNTKLFVLESGQEYKSDGLKLFSGLLINTKVNNIVSSLKTLGLDSSSDIKYYKTMNGLKLEENDSDGTKYTFVYNSYGLITKCTAKNKDKNSKNNFNSTFKYSRD